MGYYIQSLKFFIYKRILGRKFLKATDTVFNLNFHIDSHDGMGRRIFKRGSLNPEHAQFLLTLPYADGDIILDVGANIGWYSIVLRNSIKHKVKVYAFEPEPFNFNLLEKNIAYNQMTDIVTVNKAVAEKPGHSLLFMYFPKNSGRHSLLDINPQTKKSIQVETIKLDDFLKNQQVDFKRIKLVKIDIEGYEVLALKGASELLHQLPYMLMEYSPRLIRKSGQDPAVFLRWLTNFGFNFYEINDGKPSLRPLEYWTNLDHTTDIFLTKKLQETVKHIN